MLKELNDLSGTLSALGYSESCNSVNGLISKFSGPIAGRPARVRHTYRVDTAAGGTCTGDAPTILLITGPDNSELLKSVRNAPNTNSVTWGDRTIFLDVDDPVLTKYNPDKPQRRIVWIAIGGTLPNETATVKIKNSGNDWVTSAKATACLGANSFNLTGGFNFNPPTEEYANWFRNMNWPTTDLQLDRSGRRGKTFEATVVEQNAACAPLGASGASARLECKAWATWRLAYEQQYYARWTQLGVFVLSSALAAELPVR